ncbi:MAG: DUF4422 domain-containing protein [Lachnospiraceae bacterium]|nr:DUF4422 domain-containing protein [Lachnospiraceae bacterium]
MGLKNINRTFKTYEDVKSENWKLRVESLSIGAGEDVVIFGCGEWGKKLYSLIKEGLNINILGFCDNNINLHETEIEGLMVHSAEFYVKYFPEAIYVLAMAKNTYDIKEQLISLGIKSDNIRMMDGSNAGKLTRKYFSERLNEQYYIDEDYPSEVFIPVVKSINKDDNRDFRIYIEKGLISVLEKEIDPLETCGMNQYEDLYGKYYDTNSIDITGQGETKVKVLIACSHKDKAGLSNDNSEFYVPIQVGKALTDIKMYELCDDMGDNISDRNYNYCECSALYWAWKNNFGKDVDYVGLRHYRRKFDITEEQLRHLKENNVAIVHLDPIYHDNIKNSFSAHTNNINDWEIMKKVIFEKFPDYASAMKEYETQHFICAYNMSIMRTDIFDKYCEFLFGVLIEIENHYLKEYDRRDRYLGFLAENLTSIFIMQNKNEKQIITKLIPIIG